jgi:hypothetical protein
MEAGASAPQKVAAAAAKDASNTGTANWHAKDRLMNECALALSNPSFLHSYAFDLAVSPARARVELFKIVAGMPVMAPQTLHRS